VSTDPRYAATLDEASKNPDGTYNTYRALSWLSEALNPGKGLPVEEIQKIAKEVYERRTP